MEAPQWRMQRILLAVALLPTMKQRPLRVLPDTTWQNVVTDALIRYYTFQNISMTYDLCLYTMENEIFTDYLLPMHPTMTRGQDTSGGFFVS